jgi:hypothetical protein
MVIATSAFQGVPGSVYVGRAVELPLGLLFLPIGAWAAGSFLGGRLFAWGLDPTTAANPDRPFALSQQYHPQGLVTVRSGDRSGADRGPGHQYSGVCGVL